jgi:Transposase
LIAAAGFAVVSNPELLRESAAFRISNTPTVPWLAF